jgi:hypothetical protein
MRIVEAFVLPALVAGFVALASLGTEAAGPPDKHDAAARKLYVTKCAKCHKFYDPAKYSDEQWAGWMAKMSKKARLTPDQQEELTHYIDDTLRHPSDRRAPALREQGTKSR